MAQVTDLKIARQRVFSDNSRSPVVTLYDGEDNPQTLLSGAELYGVLGEIRDHLARIETHLSLMTEWSDG